MLLLLLAYPFSFSLLFNDSILNKYDLTRVAVSIDYSLFMISRFREELEGGSSTEDAIATMMHTAGRAILYSGYTQALQSILLHGDTHAFDGYRAFLAVLGANVFPNLLPARCIPRPRINSLRVPIPGANRKTKFWENFSKVCESIRWLLPAMALLLLLGSPFLACS